MTKAGQGVATFAWRPTDEVIGTIAGWSYEKRVGIANKLLLVASRLNLIIADGRPTGGGLLYYEDVAHVLEDGRFPTEIAGNDDNVDHATRRYTAYTALSRLLKGNTRYLLEYH